MMRVNYFLIGWLMIVSGGVVALARHSLTAGGAGAPPVEWPSQAHLSLNAKGFTLVMLAHPRCSCTRASLKELAKVVVSSKGRLHATVLFYNPRSVDENWRQTDVWTSASEIPNVTLLVDSEGSIARLFGAKTSGHTLLYDRKGRLIFAGGITGARGHEGDNVGEDAIVALIAEQSERQQEDFVHTPTFGCHLHNVRAEREVSLESK